MGDRVENVSRFTYNCSAFQFKLELSYLTRVPQLSVLTAHQAALKILTVFIPSLTYTSHDLSLF